MNCNHCGAETNNGLALCALCQRKASLCMEFLPIYFRNLSRWRPGRAGARPVPGSRVLYDGEVRGTGDRISDRLDEALSMLTTWARCLRDDRPGFPRPLTLTDAVLTDDLPPDIADALSDDQAKVVALLCAAFTEHLTTVATLGWCGQMVRDLDHHEAILRGLTETAVPGWYAGACARQISMEATCGASTYVVPGLTWVTCGTCGVTTYARDHLEVVLNEAREWVARPRYIAEAIVAMVDTEQSVPLLHDRIRKWASLGRLNGVRRLDRDGDPVGPNRYLFGDVFDLVTGKADTLTRVCMTAG